MIINDDDDSEIIQRRSAQTLKHSSATRGFPTLLILLRCDLGKAEVTARSCMSDRADIECEEADRSLISEWRAANK